MIELGVGFSGELTGQENVFLNAAIHGLARQEIVDLYPRVVEYSGLGDFMEVPLKSYSSGMHMRLGFAIAANLNPDILLIDEIFAARPGAVLKPRRGSLGTLFAVVDSVTTLNRSHYAEHRAELKEELFEQRTAAWTDRLRARATIQLYWKELRP